MDFRLYKNIEQGILKYYTTKLLVIQVLLHINYKLRLLSNLMVVFIFLQKYKKF